MISSSPIVVLDSGLGGLTVVRAIRDRMPEEDIVYFGDTARLPYGSKTAATVSSFVKQIISYLLPNNPKHIVIACNTATALALAEVRKAFPGLHISGVIGPGSRAATQAADANPTIGIIATEATIRSGAYEKTLHCFCPGAKIIPLATPLLVPLIEDGRDMNDPLVQLALKQYLDPMLTSGMQILLLGCTHYPILKSAIEAHVGNQISVVDSAQMCAEDVYQRLLGRTALAPARQRMGYLKCFVTDDPQRFARLGSRFLGHDIPEPAWVSADELYAQVEPTPIRAAM